MDILFKHNRYTARKIFVIFLFCVALVGVKKTQAALGIDVRIKQVKYPDSSTIYYLNHEKGIRKAYVNEAAFLSYGNTWSDVKVIVPECLDLWTDAEVVKTKNNPTVYVIMDGAKRAIKSEAEFLDLGYKWNQVIEISSFDLLQYIDTDYDSSNSDDGLYIVSAGTEPSLFTLSKVDGKIISSFNVNSKVKNIKINTIGFRIERGDETVSLNKLYIVNHKTGELIKNVEVGSGDYYSVDINKSMGNKEKKIGLTFVADLSSAKPGDYYKIIIEDLNYEIGGVDQIYTGLVEGEKYEIHDNLSNTSIVDSASTDMGLAEDASAGGDTDYDYTSSDDTYSDYIPDENISNSTRLYWPVNGRVSYTFHDPKYLYNFVHQGIDIQASQGTAVRASQAGIVETIIKGGMTGYSYVVINHGDGLKTVYGHLSEINVVNGQGVSMSTVIGRSGGTPGTSGAGQYSNGPHLHFEVIKDDIYVDPEIYLL